MAECDSCVQTGTRAHTYTLHTPTVQRHAGSGTWRHLRKHNGASCVSRERVLGEKMCEKERKRNKRRNTIDRQSKRESSGQQMLKKNMKCKHGCFQRVGHGGCSVTYYGTTTEQLPRSSSSSSSFNRPRAVFQHVPAPPSRLHQPPPHPLLHSTITGSSSCPQTHLTLCLNGTRNIQSRTTSIISLLLFTWFCLCPCSALYCLEVANQSHTPLPPLRPCTCFFPLSPSSHFTTLYTFYPSTSQDLCKRWPPAHVVE